MSLHADFRASVFLWNVGLVINASQRESLCVLDNLPRPPPYQFRTASWSLCVSQRILRAAPVPLVLWVLPVLSSCWCVSSAPSRSPCSKRTSSSNTYCWSTSWSSPTSSWWPTSPSTKLRDIYRLICIN